MKNDGVARGTPEAYKKYMLENPFYVNDLCARMTSASEGHVLLWVNVVEQAVAAAQMAQPRPAADIAADIAKARQDRSMPPRRRNACIDGLNRQLARARAIEWDRALAVSFLRSPMFSFICTECNIDYEAARCSLATRLRQRATSRKGERARRMRVAGYGPRAPRPVARRRGRPRKGESLHAS